MIHIIKAKYKVIVIARAVKHDAQKHIEKNGGLVFAAFFVNAVNAFKIFFEAYTAENVKKPFNLTHLSDPFEICGYCITKPCENQRCFAVKKRNIVAQSLNINNKEKINNMLFICNIIGLYLTIGLIFLINIVRVFSFFNQDS